MYISIDSFTPNKRIDEFAFALYDVLFDEVDPSIMLAEEDTFLNIDFIDDVEDEACGYCFRDECDDITIQINNNLSEREQALTLAHEMVHARQLVRGVEFDEQEAYTLESLLTDSLLTVH
jgi:Zn-dependent peptidase ImmA (M78 family)